MALPIPSPEQQIINTSCSYALQSFFESTASAGIAQATSLLDPISTTIYAVGKFIFGLPVNYACDEIFEGPAASTASRVISYILKTALPLLASLGIAFGIGLPITFSTLAYLTLSSIGVSALSVAAQKAGFIFELGYRQYRLII